MSVSTQVSHPHRQSTNEHAYQTSAEAGVCENCPPEVSSGMSQRYPNISKPRQALVPHDLSYDWCPCHPIRQAGHQSLMFSASTINKAWHCHLINFSQTQPLGSNPNTSTLVKKLLTLVVPLLPFLYHFKLAPSSNPLLWILTILFLHCSQVSAFKRLMWLGQSSP